MRIAILVAILVAAVPLIYAAEVAYGGYAGESATLRRFMDPYSRYMYFGENATKSTVGYGSKGPIYGQTTTGAKSAYSSVFNLDTNAFYNRGRDPSKISNWDPNIRGFSQVDEVVELLPLDLLEFEENTLSRGPKGTARVLSRGDAYGAGLNTRLPRGDVYIQTRDLPPVPSNQAYEAWLVDEESGYMMSIGILKTSAKFTAQLDYSISRQLTGFDALMITLENYPDVDPTPSEVVLFGSIGPSRSVVASLGDAAPQRLR